MLPSMVTAPPGRKSLALSATLAAAEAPIVNTIYNGKPAIVWSEAEGSNVIDVDGNRYLDLTAGFGVASVGHRHPRVVEAVLHQSTRLLHGLGDVHAHSSRVELAERLRQISPIDDSQVYFAISGADAVEIALKTAHLSTGRAGVIAFEPAYHGLTLGALSVSSRAPFRSPFAEALRPGVHRLNRDCSQEELEGMLDRHPSIGSVIVEPIAGREGVLYPQSGWLQMLSQVCRDHDVVLIADEILTGFGRTGTLFAVEAEDIQPDLLCCGKALAGGLPIGAVLGRRSLMAAWQVEGEALHTATFLANPLSCAAALAVLGILEEEGLVERAAALGEIVRARLQSWGGFARVLDIRGRGLLWGIEMEGRLASTIAEQALRRGVLVLPSGPEGGVLQICPPLSIARFQLDEALSILERLLEDGGSSE